MQIRLNGKPHPLDGPLTLAELIRTLELGAERVAVAVNREVVPRGEHATRALRDGDEVEVIQAVAGG
jgi:sulfur carrier protein